MVDVIWYHVGSAYRTDVWAARIGVLKKMAKHAKRKRDEVARFRALLKRCAKVGLDRAHHLLEHEGNGVFAIGQRPGPLLRAAGFYSEDTGKHTFVLMEFYEKTGQGLTEPQREMLKEVARIRDSGDWRFVDA